MIEDGAGVDDDAKFRGCEEFIGDAFAYVSQICYCDDSAGFGI